MAQFVDITDPLSDLLSAVYHYEQRSPDAPNELVKSLTAFQRQVEGPPTYLSRIRSQPLLNMCMLMALETGVLDAIVQSKGKPVSASDLAAATHQPESLIIRFMRLLTVNGICEETAPKTYASNPTAALLNTPEQEGPIRNTVDLMFPIGGKLVPQLRQPGGLSEFADSPGDMPPFRAAYGMSMFEYFNTNAEHKRAFDNYMAGRRAGVRRNWYDYYPLSERVVEGAVPDGVLLVDVGGSKGHDLVDLHKKFVNAPGRLVLQDLSVTLQDVDLSSEGIEAMAHNFFEPQPIQGARAYYFRAIMHDWSDSKCRQILLHTAKAMKPGYSKIIIEDMVLPEMNASMRAASIDILMFVMVEGVERSIDQWKALLDSAGLKISGVWHGGNGGESTIEAVLKDDRCCNDGML